MAVAVYPAQVQGTASPGSVVRALRRCNSDGDADVVVIARGGGSFEELWAFNTEVVARAILASRIPVVTALGHTSDRTIADMVADAECRTPTEAGARVVPAKAELLRQVSERRRRVEREARMRIRNEMDRLEQRRRSLRQALPSMLRRCEERLARARAELRRLGPAHQVGLRQRALEERRRRLHDLSPERVLARGYSITMDAETGRALKAAGETSPGRRVRVRLARGEVGARVEQTT
jgi:exodeoxyribonuclease VII large subunit